MTLNVQHMIHYIDNDFVIVNKPSGLPSVPTKNPVYPDNLYHLLQAHLPPVYVVHRLDINTSGLIIYARTRKALSYFGRAFQKRQISKTYHALLHGNLAADYGTIQLPIIPDRLRLPKQKLCFTTGKSSTTLFKKLAWVGSNTLVEFTPLTGRSHQLRIHSQLIGHPICGCRLYGPNESTFPRLMLHSKSVGFKHPITHLELAFDSDSNFLKVNNLSE